MPIGPGLLPLGGLVGPAVGRGVLVGCLEHCFESLDVALCESLVKAALRRRPGTTREQTKDNAEARVAMLHDLILWAQAGEQVFDRENVVEYSAVFAVECGLVKHHVAT